MVIFIYLILKCLCVDVRCTRALTHTNTQVRGGGLTELEMSQKEGLPVALAAAGLLETSAAKLTKLNVG